jgi:type I restriction enzyme R subunit
LAWSAVPGHRAWGACGPAHREQLEARLLPAAEAMPRLRALKENAEASSTARLDLARAYLELGRPRNAETEMKEAKRKLDELGLFKSDLVAFTRYYEFMSQIVDYDSHDLEKLSLYARHLAPLLREKAPDDDPVDLSSVELSHYRLSKIKQQDLMMVKEGADTGLYPATDLGTGKARSKEEEWLSQIITRLNDLFVTDGLTDRDLINYAYTIRDKISENERVMHQIANNSAEQALLGDFAGALDEAVMESSEAHQSQMMQYLNSKELQAGFQRVVFDMLLAKKAPTARDDRV